MLNVCSTRSRKVGLGGSGVARLPSTAWLGCVCYCLRVPKNTVRSKAAIVTDLLTEWRTAYDTSVRFDVPNSWNKSALYEHAQTFQNLGNRTATMPGRFIFSHLSFPASYTRHIPQRHRFIALYILADDISFHSTRVRSSADIALAFPRALVIQLHCSVSLNVQRLGADDKISDPTLRHRLHLSLWNKEQHVTGVLLIYSLIQ